VYLNSPMAVDVTRVFVEARGEHRLDERECDRMCRGVRFVNSVEESRQLNARRGPMVIVSASGMATGGRVLHHLRAFGPDPRNTILFAGYQAAGTRGAAIVHGADAVKIHGQYVPIRAEVVCLDQLSAHADREQLLHWLAAVPRMPQRVFVTHGEPTASDRLRAAIGERLGWEALVPEHRSTHDVDSAAA
jgi:metallo-beta-lactamase family protein